MYEQQLDLFSCVGIQVDHPVPMSMELRPAATVLDDRALIAAIPDSNLADSIALAAEAGRRRLAAAVPSLETLCRRFSGFGIDRMVPEQAAALEALSAIGGREAARAVSRLIVRAVVQGPTLNLAVSTAARIGSALRRTCPSHPQHPFHKQTIVVSAASRIPDLSWQFRCDPFPLGVAQYRANQG